MPDAPVAPGVDVYARGDPPEALRLLPPQIREHLESLFEAKERKVSSIQEYLDNEQNTDPKSSVVPLPMAPGTPGATSSDQSSEHSKERES